jgi:hypothetical protein
MAIAPACLHEQRASKHDTAPDIVRQSANSEQAHQQREDIYREDQRQGELRKFELGLIDGDCKTTTV